MAPTYTRRRLLSGAVAGTAMAGLAGCAGDEGEGAGEEVYDPADEPDEPADDVTEDPWEADRTQADDSD